METSISLIQLVLVLITSGLGGYVGVRVAIVQNQERISVLQEEVRVLRKRTHKHSTLITILAARLGLHADPLVTTSEEEG